MGWDYLSRLSRAARWYLPPADAAEVLEDYREIVAGRSEEELRRDLGTPRAVVRQLAQPKAYRRWLMVFAVLSVCVVLPAITPFWQELSLNVFRLFRVYWFWDIGQNVVPFTRVFFAVGMVTSLVWFRRNSRGGPAERKGIWPLLLLLLAGMAWVWFLSWVILTERWDIFHVLVPTERWAAMMRLTLGADSLAMGLLGLFGLVKSRWDSARWGAVYVLGLAGVILGFSVWALLTSTCTTLPSDPGTVARLLREYAFITVAGLFGTGVALC